jgi:hypothetical protein
MNTNGGWGCCAKIWPRPRRPDYFPGAAAQSHSGSPTTSPAVDSHDPTGSCIRWAADFLGYQEVGCFQLSAQQRHLHTSPNG